MEALHLHKITDSFQGRIVSDAKMRVSHAIPLMVEKA